MEAVVQTKIEVHPAVQSIQESETRVAAYCRVSTNLEEQQGSLKTQMEAFQSLIFRKEGWELVDVYADEGISGTQAAHREEFQRLMQDCKDGKVDYIITKSISRFARNTLECLYYIRQLKEMGVHIIFEENNLDTGTETSELVLSILAAVAQEESRAISSNLKWSWEKRFKAGKGKWSLTYGYKKEGERDYIVDERTAPIVRRIFEAYYKGESLPAIVRALEKDSVPAPYGGKNWWPKVLANILSNEKYIGDALLQKTYTTDHLTHKRVKNLNSEAAANYYVKNHHEPIVSRELFENVQIIRSLKDTRFGAVQYPYHTFLICPYCKRAMARNTLSEHGRPGVWRCSNCCSDYFIYERDVDKAFLKSYRIFSGQKDAALLLKTEYYLLAEYVDSIHFPRISQDQDWRLMQINWKNGRTTYSCMEYKRERDIPGSEAQRRAHPEAAWADRVGKSTVRSGISHKRSCFFNSDSNLLQKESDSLHSL